VSFGTALAASALHSHRRLAAGEVLVASVRARDRLGASTSLVLQCQRDCYTVP
jgi:hypothetical protein